MSIIVQNETKNNGEANNKPKKPARKPVNFDNVPEELKQLSQWCLWRYELRRNKATGELKWTKVPYQVRGFRQRAESNNASTWGSWNELLTAWEVDQQRPVPYFDGIGFFVDGFVGIDLDKCFEGGKPSDETKKIIDDFSSYTEVSPSGKGVRIFCRGSLPVEGRKKGNFEIYSQERFLTVTGDRLPFAPTTIETNQEAIDRFHERYIGTNGNGKPKKTDSGNPQISTSDEGEYSVVPSGIGIEEVIATACQDSSFKRLFDGDTTGYPSQSEPC